MDKMEIGQEEKSRKKLLVPLIVLLLCAVSLTGAAYAYNSTVTNVENNVHVEGVTLDLKDGDSATVTTAMYDFNVAYGPHNTQGKAVKYVIGDDDNTYGFISKTYDSGTETWTDEDQYFKNVDSVYKVTEFDTGYYVETTVDTGNGTYVGPAKYQTVTSYGAKADLDQAVTDADKGVYKLKGEYKLTLDNESDKAVTLKMKGQYDAEPKFNDGVKAIYLVVKSTQVEKIISLIPSANSAVIDEVTIDSLAANDNGVVEYTVSAYAVCSDYYSADMPGNLDKDYGFVLQFTAATA